MPFTLAPQKPSDLASQATLELHVPARRRDAAVGAGDPLIDVVVVNWIEVRYPWNRRLDAGQIRLADQASPGRVQWRAPAGRSWSAISETGLRSAGSSSNGSVSVALPPSRLDLVVDWRLPRAPGHVA